MSKEPTVTDLLINRFGSLNALARALGKTPSTVQRWKDSGTVPLEHWPLVSQAALREGFYEITVQWLAQLHGNQSVRAAALKAAEEGDKTTKCGAV